MSRLERLAISEDHHFFVTESGKPFFWLGDTAWNLFHRLTREEIIQYYENRRDKGFTVVQAVILTEQDGLNTPNVYDERPLHDNNPAQPNEAYFARIDDYLTLAAEHGLYVCLLPTWADKVTPDWGAGPVIFTPDHAETAENYGRWLAERYGERSNIVWCLGGDRPPRKDAADWMPIWRAMANGIRAVCGTSALITYHPDGGMDAPTAVHAEQWSDCVLIQSGHWARETPTWEWIEQLYAMQPAKPALDAEPNYEDHPAVPWPVWNPHDGYFRDYEVRKQCYRSVFAGGAGVTYGHHSIWQCASPRYPYINHTDRTWVEALDRPGAAQMINLRRLIESRPCVDRVPDQSLLEFIEPGGGQHPRAFRDAHGRYLMVYAPTFQNIALKGVNLAGARVCAWWFNPRTGCARQIGEFDNQPRLSFPTPIDGPDWVLVIDSVEAGFAPPGTP